MVPSFPIRLGSPRAHDHSPVFLIGWSEELSSDPTRSLPRGRQTSTHNGVPVSSGFWLQVHVSHDSLHRKPPEASGSLPVPISTRQDRGETLRPSAWWP